MVLDARRQGGRALGAPGVAALVILALAAFAGGWLGFVGPPPAPRATVDVARGAATVALTAPADEAGPPAASEAPDEGQPTAEAPAAAEPPPDVAVASAAPAPAPEPGREPEPTPSATAEPEPAPPVEPETSPTVEAPAAPPVPAAPAETPPADVAVATAAPSPEPAPAPEPGREPEPTPSATAEPEPAPPVEPETSPTVEAPAAPPVPAAPAETPPADVAVATAAPSPEPEPAPEPAREPEPTPSATAEPEPSPTVDLPAAPAETPAADVAVASAAPEPEPPPEPRAVEPPPAPLAQPVPPPAGGAAPAGDIWLAYARPFDAPRGRARVAVVVTGLGLSPAATAAAIRLPGAVTLGFLSYARNLQKWIDLARAAGHEVVLDVPMEPMSYPKNDPGPNALLTSLSSAENVERLKWHLSRATGYVGITHNMGSRFTASADHLRPVLSALKVRGLMFLDSRTSSASVAAKLASTIGLPRAINDRFIDAQASQPAIDKRLGEIERIARRNGYAVAMGQPFPVTLGRLDEWLGTLEKKGLVAAPISAVVNRQALR